MFTLFFPNSGGNSLQYHELKFWQRPILCQGLGKTLHMCHSELVLSKGFGEVLFGMVCSCGGFRGNVSSWFGRCFAGFLVMTVSV